MPENYERPNLTGYLDALKDRCPQIIHAVLLTGDGLFMACDSGYHRDDADPTAAHNGSIAGLCQDQSAFCDSDKPLDWEGTFSGVSGMTTAVLPAGRNSRLTVSVNARYTSPEAAAAAAEAVKTIANLREVFAAEDRHSPGPSA